MNKDQKLSIVWWGVLPLAFFLASVAVQAFASLAFNQALLMENGPVEILQPIIMLIAFLVTAFTIKRAISTKNKWLIAWTVLALIGTFYITGEEISWGQWIFQWQTPDNWMLVNDHHETNLHNTSSWFDQKPRTLLEIGILVGGILIPLYRRFKVSPFLTKFEIILPPDYLWLTATCLWITKLAKDLNIRLDTFGLVRTSELNEVYIYYFILLYIIAFRRQLARIGPERTH